MNNMDSMNYRKSKENNFQGTIGSGKTIRIVQSLQDAEYQGHRSRKKRDRHILDIECNCIGPEH
jgi:hypothetical protein